MPTIYQRPNGRWVATVRVAKKSTSKTFPTKAEAKVWAYEVETQTRSQKALVPTLRDFAPLYREKYLSDQKGRKRSEEILDRMVQVFGDLRLTQIDSEALRAYRDARLVRVKPSTLQRELALLYRLLRVAKADFDYPIGDIPRVILPAMKPTEVRAISPEEEDLILRHIRSDHLRRLVVVAIETGMRRSELLRITVSDVRLEDGVVTLHDTKNGRPRVVPLSTKARQALRDQLQASGSEVANSTLWRYAPESVSTLFKRACRCAGIDDVHFHCLRHTACTRLFRKGLDVVQVSTITGHRSVNVLKRYTHISGYDLIHLLD